MARKKSSSKARRLHRFLGTAAAIFVIFMVLSGITINHSNDFGLDQRPVTQNLLLDWYGLGEPEIIRSFELGSDWLSFAGSQMYLNGKHVAMVSNGIGAIVNSDMIVVAGSDELLLLDDSGNLIERVTWGSTGTGPISAIGQLDNGTVVVSSINHLWLADRELLNWNLATDTPSNPAWSIAAVAPAALDRAIAKQYRGDGLSLERILLDFHSGRFFGPVGVLIYDLLAISVCLMAISGLVLWVRGRRNGKRGSKRKKTNS